VPVPLNRRTFWRFATRLSLERCARDGYLSLIVGWSDGHAHSWTGVCALGRSLAVSPKGAELAIRFPIKEHHRSISIVVADDHPSVRHGVADLLRSNSSMNVVSVCNDGPTALEAIRKWSPDVAVLDIFLPGLTGLDVLARIAADGLATKVLFLAATASERQHTRAVVQGIVFKEEALTELVGCIRTLAEGQRWSSSALVSAALEHETKRRSPSQHLTQLLTIRERQVVLLIADGLSNKEAARRLGLSEGTIKIYLYNIYRKLHVNNRTALAAVAIAHRNDLTSTRGHKKVKS
jgi:two-component system, NarL family, nitrate/nitrite response regulator NarL